MAASITAFSFLSCVLAYAGLALMLRPGHLGRGLPRTRLRIAALVTSVWALFAWWVTATGYSGAGAAQLSAVVLLSLWVWQLEPIARWLGQPRWFLGLLRRAGPGLSALTAVVMIVPAGTFGGMSRLVPPLAGLILASLGLFAIEQIIRNAPPIALSALRWFCLGVGGLFVAELVVIAQALLLGGIPIEPWVARGVVFALCAAAMARGALVMPDWSFGLSVSRHVVFYSTSFTVIGGYLLLMSAGGWWLLSVEGWGRWAQLAFALLAGIALAGLLFSSSLLRRWRVFISKHFYPHRYDYRHEWLRFIGTLSDPGPVSVAQKCIRAVSEIIESPRGTLWRINDTESAFEQLETWGAGLQCAAAEPVPCEDVLPVYLERTGWLVDLKELRDRSAIYSNLQLDPDRYSALPNGLIVPLLHMKQLYGWLVLERPAGMAVLTFEDRDLLKTAGQQIAVQLAQHDADARLAEARQFETYNRMTAFVMHDLKNLAAQLRLVSQNAERHRQNPEFIDDALRTVGAASARMTRLIAQLADASDTGTFRTADLATLVERAASSCSSIAPLPKVMINERPTVFADVDRLGAVIEHTIRNAQEATDPTGEVRVEIDRVDAGPVIRIVDTGCGMDQAFIRDRLFRPFDTTKGAKGMGIGAFQVREYLRSLGGSVEVQSVPGAGTTFTMIFPATGAVSQARRLG